MFLTVQFARLRGRTGQTTGGSPSFFESMDGLGQMEAGPDALHSFSEPFFIPVYQSLANLFFLS